MQKCHIFQIDKRRIVAILRSFFKKKCHFLRDKGGEMASLKIQYEEQDNRFRIITQIFTMDWLLKYDKKQSCSGSDFTCIMQ